MAEGYGDAKQRNVMQCNATQRNTLQCGAVQCNAVCMLWLNFNVGLKSVFLSFKLIVTHFHTSKTKDKIRPQNIYLPHTSHSPMRSDDTVKKTPLVAAIILKVNQWCYTIIPPNCSKSFIKSQYVKSCVSQLFSRKLIFRAFTLAFSPATVILECAIIIL